VIPQHLGELITGELRPLIGIEDAGIAEPGEGLAQRLDTEPRRQRVATKMGRSLVLVLAITIETTPIRYRDDGVAPTVSTGIPLVQGQNITYTGNKLSALVFVASQAGTATINVLFYGIWSPKQQKIFFFCELAAAFTPVPSIAPLSTFAVGPPGCRRRCPAYTARAQDKPQRDRPRMLLFYRVQPPLLAPSEMIGKDRVLLD
jgi:hypothetical protein